MLNASEAAGLRCDGRLLDLNSYENRVYQASLEDGTSVVAKFYRPRRWSDAQIAEEHRFALELAEREIPVVAPLRLGGAGQPRQAHGHHRTQHHHSGDSHMERVLHFSPFTFHAFGLPPGAHRSATATIAMPPRTFWYTVTRTHAGAIA